MLNILFYLFSVFGVVHAFPPIIERIIEFVISLLLLALSTAAMFGTVWFLQNTM